MSDPMPSYEGYVPFDQLERFEIVLSEYQGEVDEFLSFVIETLGDDEPEDLCGSLTQTLEELLERLASMPEEDEPGRLRACVEFQNELVEVEAEYFAEALREADAEVEQLCEDNLSVRHPEHANAVLARWAEVKSRGWHTYSILICATI